MEIDMSRIIALDYSMNGPCICILNEDKTFQNSQFYFLTSTKKYVGKWNNIIGTEHKPYKNSVQRYNDIADFFIKVSQPESDDKFFLEDYALGAKGLVYSIGENGGILKYKLQYERNVKIQVISPTPIKKFLTGSGGASKTNMYDAFKIKTGIDLCKLLDYKPVKIESPVSDITDAYALALLGSTL